MCTQQKLQAYLADCAMFRMDRSRINKPYTGRDSRTQSGEADTEADSRPGTSTLHQLLLSIRSPRTALDPAVNQALVILIIKAPVTGA